MSFALTGRDYVEYLKQTAERIAGEKEYISALDAATGDGDHWANIHKGFSALTEQTDELELLSPAELFKRIGMILMSSVGGSSGVLYGSAYLAAAKAAGSDETVGPDALCRILDAMCGAIMERGQAQPGDKTMIDAIHPAAGVLRDGLAAEEDLAALLERTARASEEGAAKTADMEARRGRACYQANKGVGHLDPGAVTMSYQIAGLMRFAADRVSDG